MSSFILKFFLCSFTIFMLLFGLKAFQECTSTSPERRKRFVIFPYGGSYKMVLGIGIPIMLPKPQILSVAWNIQFQYPQITNLTQIEEGLPPFIKRKRRSDGEKSERALTYMALETLLERYGINGKACLLKSICENAMHSLYHDENGLYGQLVDIILTPEYNPKYREVIVDDEYVDARKAGEYGVDCLSLYPDCPVGQGLLDMISVLDEN